MPLSLLLAPATPSPIPSAPAFGSRSPRKTTAAAFTSPSLPLLRCSSRACVFCSRARPSPTLRCWCLCYAMVTAPWVSASRSARRAGPTWPPVQPPCRRLLAAVGRASPPPWKMAWSIRSNADGRNELEPSSMNGTDSGTRLIRTIRNIQSKLGRKIQEIRKNLPMKLFFFLVGFYCATAFATVIGQTGDWDILSAALAVVVVEGIGALMYKASLHLVSNVRSLITMFNYWKAGLSLGLFLDSFKYEMDNFIGSINLFNLCMDLFPRFL